MKRRTKLTVAATAVAALAVGVPVYALADAPSETGPQSTGETYADYSMMESQQAGQVYTSEGGNLVTQWAWKPAGDGTAEIQWGNPDEGWPPNSGEAFERDGDWVYMTGYYDHERDLFNEQHITSESIGDANCENMEPLETDGRQHYVKWDVPEAGYCLHAEGTITVEANGAVVNFSHDQIWYPPEPCANQYLGEQTCIRQHEVWSDDNQHDFQKVLERDQSIARGLGMAFRIDQTFDINWGPGTTEWHAEMKDSWAW